MGVDDGEVGLQHLLLRQAQPVRMPDMRVATVLCGLGADIGVSLRCVVGDPALERIMGLRRGPSLIPAKIVRAACEALSCAADPRGSQR